MKKLLTLFLLTALSLSNRLAVCQTWTNLGTGMNGSVSGLYADNTSGLLYAVGAFTSAGGVPADGIAVWDGNNWSALGSLYYYNFINEIIVWNGEVYVGGAALMVDNTVSSPLVKWDGNAWSHVGTNFINSSASVNALEVYNGELIIGLGGSLPADSAVMKWDGNAFTAIGAGSTITSVYSLLTAGGVLYAGGYGYVSKWNGSTWTVLGSTAFSGQSAAVYSLAISNGILYAGGSFEYCAWPDLGWSIAKFVDGQWRPLFRGPFNCGLGVGFGDGYPGWVFAMKGFQSQLFFGGYFSKLNAGMNYCEANLLIPSSNMGTYSGLNFNASPSPPNGDVTCFTIFNEELVIAGNFTTIGGSPCNRITLHTPPPVGWAGFYHSVEGSGDYLENLTLLGSSQTNYSPAMQQPLKICADGSKATLMKFMLPGVNQASVRFRIKSDPNSSNPDDFGQFQQSDYYIYGDTVIARFTHPTRMQQPGTFASDTIEIYHSGTGLVMLKQPVQFFRAPVVFVHGIWSNGDFWKPLEEELWNNGIPAALTYRTDYTATNAKHFSYNSFVLPEAIRRILRQALEAKYSAGKVDIIAHSMGGVLSRLYLQSDNYKNNIHKLITVNSPLSGAQSCDLIMNPLVGPFMRALFGGFGMNCSEGAVEDFQVESPAILIDLNGNSLNDHTAPSHTMTTYQSAPSFIWGELGNWNYLFMLAATAAFIGTYEGSAALTLALYMGDNHDIIVPQQSQTAGCAATTSVNPFWHSAWKDYHTELFTPLIDVLKQPVDNSSYYSTAGFNPPHLTSILFSPQDTANLQHPQDPYRNSGEVSITNVTDIDTITSNEYATFQIAATGDVQRMLLVVGANPDAMLFTDTIAPSASLSFLIPNEFFDKAVVKLIGYDDSGILDVDSLEMVVKDNGLNYCNSITTYPDTLFLIPGASGAFLTRSQCTNGERLVSYSDSCTFQSLNPAVAYHLSGNIFTGNQPGTAEVAVNYRGLADTVIIVVDDTTTIPPVITTIGNNHHSETQSSNRQVIAYPNPFNSSITFVVDDNIIMKNAVLSVMDIMGREVKHMENISSNRFDADMEELRSGIYFYRLHTSPKGGGSILTGKIVKE